MIIESKDYKLAHVFISKMYWHCDYLGDRIHIYSDYRDYGYYMLMTEPCCEKCSYPGVTAEDCPWCEDVYGFDKIYAMGSYLSSKSKRGREDLLSSHILGLKRYRNYKDPLGESIGLCIRHRWPELLDMDVIVPVPKLEPELKIDQENSVRYNQAVELASVIGSRTEVSVEQTLNKLTPLSLRSMDRSQRRESVIGVYEVTDGVDLGGLSIMLVDDVATSLSTSCECSQVLKNAGAEVVNVVVAGRDELID